MLKIWGRINSINVQKVVWAAGEVGQPFERIDAGMAYGVVDTLEYRAKNPNGLVPCLEDGDLVLWESNAIVRYLAAQYAPGTLWPTDPKVRAQADKWMDWQATSFYAAMHPAFMGLVRTPPEKRDQAAIEASIVKFEAAMAILDAQLAKSAFAAGASFGMADIALGVVAHRWLNMPVTRKPAPNVARWYGMIAARPAAEPALPLPVT